MNVLAHLFDSTKLLKVPSYQRAYAWEEKQLEQFVSDMLEIAGKKEGQYYFGHFILEETNGCFEIIDGQQRITTFILFLMVCSLYKNSELYKEHIDKFETVDYDQKLFEKIKAELKDTSTDFEFTSHQENKTLSIQRILDALKYFKKLFTNQKLDKSKIDKYVATFTEASISTHITDKKAVAVQIFELQNTRGIKLNLIEKVKSKLMKAVYLNAESAETENKIKVIQHNFARIYELEEQAASSAFRGVLELEDILLHHLRMVDDGSKLDKENTDSDFNSPSIYGNKEDTILNYINDRIDDVSNKVDYITSLAEKFRKSVELVSKKLPEYDEKNRLIGDVLILDKGLSLDFFILLYHLGKENLFQNEKLTRQWELLVFTRDFHDKYYRQQYRDNFAALFHEVIKDVGNLENTLDDYINKGFRSDLMDDKRLTITVSKYIEDNKSNILNNAFHWWTEKMVYILYKYEISLGADLSGLRNIMKNGRSVEHILPQSWEWDWIGEGGKNEISEKGKKFNEEIGSIINGIGNLLLITPSENSSLSNTHPKEKIYKPRLGGSYSKHNEESEKWKDNKKWKSIIEARSKDIFEFMKEFIKP